jgi:hypothetical protein
MIISPLGVLMSDIDPRNARSSDSWTSLAGTAGISLTHRERLLGFYRAADRGHGWTQGEVRDSSLGLQQPNIWRRAADLERDGLAYTVTDPLTGMIMTRIDPGTGRPQMARRATPHWPDFVPMNGGRTVLPPCVLWCDPGLTTGLAWFASGQHHTGEWDFMAAGDRIEQTCREFGRGCWLGFERYDVDVHRPQDDANSAIEVIGVAKREAAKHHCRLLTPAAPGQRKVATMKMLKALSWWAPGKKDSQSASQHMLAWMLRENAAPPGVRQVLSNIREG